MDKIMSTNYSFIQSINNNNSLSQEQKNALISAHIRIVRYNQLKSMGHRDELVGFFMPVDSINLLNQYNLSL